MSIQFEKKLFKNKTGLASEEARLDSIEDTIRLLAERLVYPEKDGSLASHFRAVTGFAAPWVSKSFRRTIDLRNDMPNYFLGALLVFLYPQGSFSSPAANLGMAVWGCLQTPAGFAARFGNYSPADWSTMFGGIQCPNLPPGVLNTKENRIRIVRTIVMLAVIFLTVVKTKVTVEEVEMCETVLAIAFELPDEVEGDVTPTRTERKGGRAASMIEMNRFRKRTVGKADDHVYERNFRSSPSIKLPPGFIKYLEKTETGVGWANYWIRHRYGFLRKRQLQGE